MKRFIPTFTRLLIFFFLIVVLLFSAIPPLINHFLPSLLEKQGMKGWSIEITQFTPWQLHGDLSIAGDSLQPAAAGSFRIRYTPGILVHGQIEAIDLRGITIHMVSIDGKLGLKGFPLSQNPPASRPSPLTFPSLPIAAEQILLQDTKILLENSSGKTQVLLLQGKIQPDFSKEGFRSFALNGFHAELGTAGALPTSINIDCALDASGPRITADGQIHDMSGVPGLLLLPEDILLQGAMTAEIELQMDNTFRQFQQVTARAGFPQLVLTGKKFALSGSTEAAPELTVRGDTESLDFNFANLILAAPSRVQVGLTGTYQPTSGLLKGSGTILPDQLQQPVSLTFTGEHGDELTELEFALAGDKQQLQLTEQLIELGSFQLHTRLTLDGSSPEISVSFQLSTVHLPGQSLMLEDISGEMSYSPGTIHRDNRQPGSLSIASIWYKDENIAGLTSVLELSSDQLSFHGEVKSRRSGALRLNFTGSSTAERPFSLSYSLPSTQVNNGSLPRFIALPKGMTLSGKLKGEGTLAYAERGIHGTATLSLKNGILDMKEQKIHLDGLDGTLTLPSLPQPMSSPSQQLRVAAMNIGNLKLSDGRVTFRIEDENTLFIENSRFTWCSGKVESGSLRISLTNAELATVLYCDRLQFTELLGQLGITDAEGNGSLNGRLPLAFNGREMVFDDGFLFSTPGNSGIVRFNNTAMLRQGLPETGQAAHLEYSMQAMENFSYNWTKLTFNSKGEDLSISMQIDGKPAEPLPFGYRNGQLVKTGDGAGIQHPIRLDVNFHLPFAQMFKYGQSFQKMMKP